MTDDIYAPPKSDLSVDASGIEPGGKVKRPGWISAIFWIHMFMFFLMGLGFILIFTLELTPELSDMFANLTKFDYLYVFVSIGIVVIACFALYWMKRISVLFWGLDVVLTCATTVIDFFTDGVPTRTPELIGLMIGSVFSIALTIAIFLYAKRLDGRGMLS